MMSQDNVIAKKKSINRNRFENGRDSGNNRNRL